ncbi:MAG: tetratricopeptide repeat protein [Anaerolineae bacterium]|nr:tetratricopeptide repeat protein [Anaerolineae bacterium]
MPGNRQVYDQAMNAGHNAAWDQDWSAAISAYGRAIQEFPEDADSHTHLGLVLLRAGRLEDALKVYTRAHQLAQEDPIPLEKSADVLERMGRLREAAQQYVNVAEIYLAQRDLNKSIGNWEKATRLTPGLIAVHAKLARAYERIGDKPKAIREYLTLTFNFHRAKENEKALRAVQLALKLDPKHTPALNMLRALETGGEIVLPGQAQEEAPRASSTEITGFDLFGTPQRSGEREQIGEADPLGPIGEAMHEALGLLAQFVIESGELGSSGGDALQAMELQRQEIYGEAIKAYERVGFQREGAHRQAINRDGQYYDLLLYGILREEWQGQHK